MTAQQREQVDKLIKQLGDKSFKERETADTTLRQMGPVILPLLEQAAEQDDAEVALRLEQIIGHVKKKRTVVTEELMVQNVSNHVGGLTAYIQSKSLDCTSEPAINLAAAGRMAVPALQRKAKSESAFVRAAVVNALGRLKQPESLETLINVLARDAAEEPRFQAAVALEQFPVDPAREALKAAAKNDASQKVRDRAAAALAKIAA